MERKNGSYNKTKKRAMEVLEDRTWMEVPAFARKVGIRPGLRAYTYLAHLEDLGLVTRGLDARGKLHFQITDQGLERLQWLRLQVRATTTLEELIAPLFFRDQWPDFLSRASPQAIRYLPQRRFGAAGDHSGLHRFRDYYAHG